MSQGNRQQFTQAQRLTISPSRCSGDGRREKSAARPKAAAEALGDDAREQDKARCGASFYQSPACMQVPATCPAPHQFLCQLACSNCRSSAFREVFRAAGNPVKHEMVLSLLGLVQTGLLFANALAILNEKRFLEPCMSLETSFVLFCFPRPATQPIARLWAEENGLGRWRFSNLGNVV